MVFLDVGNGIVLLNHTVTRSSSEDVSILSGFVTVSVTLNQLENAIGVQVRPYLNGLGDTFEITCGLRRVGRRSDVTIFPGA